MMPIQISETRYFMLTYHGNNPDKRIPETLYLDQNEQKYYFTYIFYIGDNELMQICDSNYDKIQLVIVEKISHLPLTYGCELFKNNIHRLPRFNVVMMRNCKSFKHDGKIIEIAKNQIIELSENLKVMSVD